MSHSAGFRAATWPWGGDQPWHPFEPTTLGTGRRDDAVHRVLFAPGTKYSYSNPGVIFLGRIIELCLGRRLRGLHHQEHPHAARHDTHASSTARPTTCVPHRSHSYVRTDEGINEAALRLRHRDHRLERRPERAARRHGEVSGVPDRRRGQTADDVVLKRSSLDEMCDAADPGGDGEGGSGGDVAGRAVVLHRAPRRRRAGRPQRRSERLHLAPVPPPSQPHRVPRVVQHGHDRLVRRLTSRHARDRRVPAAAHVEEHHQQAIESHKQG